MDIFFATGQQQNMGWPPSNLQVPSQDKLRQSPEGPKGEGESEELC